MGGSVTTALGAALAPVTGGASLLLTDATKALTPKIPSIPKNDAAEKARLGLLTAQNAVLTKEAEERRARAAKRTSGVLTSGLGVVGNAPVATATLQPNPPRSTVLG